MSTARSSGYGRGARILSLGIATTGVVTFAYFSVAAHVLNEVDYKRISLLWSVLFVTVSVIYRPIEQLLARTIAARRALGHVEHPLRRPLVLQACFAGAFLLVALALRHKLQDDVFDGSAALFWILVAGVLFYGASYFARGWLAGHQWFLHYGGLVFIEATARLCFALAVAVGLANGQTAVALGMAAAPLMSLVVVPLAFARRERSDAPAPAEQPAQSSQGRFAVAVLVIFAAEQTLLNAGVLTADATSADPAVAGFVFNALLIARAPLQLFQAIQGSLLPHLSGLEAKEGRAEFNRAVRVTILATAGFAALVALGLLAIGPWAMGILFHHHGTYPRFGLALVALGMGAHLAAGTLNQAALARDHAVAAAGCWLAAAAAFIAWMLLDVVHGELLRAETGYAGAAALLCGGLATLYRH